MTLQQLRQTALRVIIVFLVAGAAGMGLASMLLPDRAPAPGDVAQDWIDLPDVTLVDQRGQAHALRSDLASGGLVVISFNYTTCTSICLLGNEVLAEVDRRMEGEVGRQVRLISITIDPRNDTPEELAQASKKLGASKDWFWLTGGTREISTVLTAMGVHFPDIESHQLVFFIGDADTGEFYRGDVDADTILSTLKVVAS